MEEVAGVAEVGDDVEGGFVFVDFVKLENVGMAGQEVEDFGLFFEAFEVGGVGEEAFLD